MSKERKSLLSKLLISTKKCNCGIEVIEEEPNDKIGIEKNKKKSK